jgi:hypothetical protein
MQEALQEVHSVLIATSLSQAITVASIEQLDVVLLAASEEDTAPLREHHQVSSPKLRNLGAHC